MQQQQLPALTKGSPESTPMKIPPRAADRITPFPLSRDSAVRKIDDSDYATSQVFSARRSRAKRQGYD
jgi:hypothetical protein